MSNTIELVLLGLALGASRAKITPFFLIVFNLFMQYVTALSDAKIGAISRKVDAGMLNLYIEHQAVIFCYLTEGFYILMFAATALFLVTRLSYFTSAIVAIQAMLSFAIAFAGYLIVNHGYDLEWAFDVHSQVNDKFVILYVLIAWIAVYLSRKTQHE